MALDEPVQPDAALRKAGAAARQNIEADHLHLQAPGAPVLIPALLNAEHRTSASDCGEVGLDTWPRTEGLAAQKGTSRVFVLTEGTDPDHHVLACCTLSAHLIDREELTPRLGRGMPAQLPAVLLGRLAISRQGSGMGEQVLFEAIARVAHLSHQVGLRYLVVDAPHEAATFYERYGFTRAPDPQALRLVMRVSPALLQP